jgi:transcriptional regulator with XRE-family HTH domain
MNKVVIVDRLSDLVLKTRKAAALTQKELGGLLGVSGLTVNRLEIGRREPTLLEMARFCDLFEIEPAMVMRLAAKTA